jgi:hypothetical protein
MHHRCTRCKEESEVRHKWHGGVYCDSCMKEIRGFRPRSRRGLFGWFRDIVIRVRDRIFRPGTKKVELSPVKTVMRVNTSRISRKEMPRQMFRQVQHKA